MDSKQLRTFERVLSYVRKQRPDFEYTLDKFKIFCSNDEFTIRDWNLDIPQPTEADLRLISLQEIKDTETREKEKRDANDPDLKMEALIKRIEALEKIINTR